MNTCARCGLPNSDECPSTNGPVSSGECFAAIASGTGNAEWCKLDCRDRELANLRSLLRSVTGKLEQARELIDGEPEARDTFAAAALIDSVLEALS